MCCVIDCPYSAFPVEGEAERGAPERPRGPLEVEVFLETPPSRGLLTLALARSTDTSVVPMVRGAAAVRRARSPSGSLVVSVTMAEVSPLVCTDFTGANSAYFAWRASRSRGPLVAREKICNSLLLEVEAEAVVEAVVVVVVVAVAGVVVAAEAVVAAVLGAAEVFFASGAVAAAVADFAASVVVWDATGLALATLAHDLGADGAVAAAEADFSSPLDFS